MSEYFMQHEADLFRFYGIPKGLFVTQYKKMSTDAKLLYGILLDRNSLSIKNNWIDEIGRVYIYFSRDEVMDMLGFCKGKVAKLFKELVKYDLIDDKRKGQGQANRIYVKKFYNSDTYKYEKKERENSMNNKKSINVTSESNKNGLPKVRKMDGNDTDFNDTNFNNKYSPRKNYKGKEIPQYANFEQREYPPEYYEKFYVNLKEGPQ